MYNDKENCNLLGLDFENISNTSSALHRFVYGYQAKLIHLNGFPSLLFLNMFLFVLALRKTALLSIFL
jgi:hypothetical protein